MNERKREVEEEMKSREGKGKKRTNKTAASFQNKTKQNRRQLFGKREKVKKRITRGTFDEFETFRLCGQHLCKDGPQDI